MAIGSFKCAKCICDANRKHEISQSHKMSHLKFRAQVPIRSRSFRRKVQHATPRSTRDFSTSTRRESNNSSVCECLVFIQISDSLSSEEAEEAVGKLWSAQYMAPGTLCAFAGAQLADTLSSSMESSKYTHAVRFRFGDMKAADSFLGNASVQQTLANELGSGFKSNTMVLFKGHVPSDLEAIFCRGSEWDSGAEHAFIFKADPKASPEEIEEYLAQLEALAGSSLAGALQSTSGKIWSSRGGDLEGTHAMLTRFETQKQLQAFLRLPPCAALVQQSSTFPVSAALSFAFDIAPPKTSRTSSPQSNLL